MERSKTNLTEKSYKLRKLNQKDGSNNVKFWYDAIFRPNTGINFFLLLRNTIYSSCMPKYVDIDLNHKKMLS